MKLPSGYLKRSNSSVSVLFNARALLHIALSSEQLYVLDGQ
jgi:hypothetical protein